MASVLLKIANHDIEKNEKLEGVTSPSASSSGGFTVLPPKQRDCQGYTLTVIMKLSKLAYL
jgi:hypothetical protein